MAPAKSEYEIARDLRIEENKRALRDIIGPSKDDFTTEARKELMKLTPKPMPVRRQPRPPAALLPRRMSSRTATVNRPDYSTMDSHLPLDPLRQATRYVRSFSRASGRSGNGSSRTSAAWATGRVVAPVEAMDEALDAATEHASKMVTARVLVKRMAPSNVAGGFWLGLKSDFCEAYLPSTKGEVTLELAREGEGEGEREEGKEGREWRAMYLPHKTGLSGGWLHFSRDNGLCEGDALVFELVESTRLRVHVFRALDQPSAAKARAKAEAQAEADKEREGDPGHEEEEEEVAADEVEVEEESGETGVDGDDALVEEEDSEGPAVATKKRKRGKTGARGSSTAKGKGSRSKKRRLKRDAEIDEEGSESAESDGEDEEEEAEEEDGCPGHGRGQSGTMRHPSRSLSDLLTRKLSKPTLSKLTGKSRAANGRKAAGGKSRLTAAARTGRRASRGGVEPDSLESDESLGSAELESVPAQWQKSGRRLAPVALAAPVASGPPTED